MKKAFLAIAIVLAFPAAARAELVTMVARDVALGDRSLSAAAAPIRFNMLGIHWRGSGSVAYRTLAASGRWSAWAVADADSGPDRGSSEARAGAGVHASSLDWVGASTRVQIRPSGKVAHVRAYYLWSKVTARAAPPRHRSLAGLPLIVPRSGWEADEKIKRAKPRYAPALEVAVVHHTAGTNKYTPAQAAAIVRGIEIYHVKGNGWNDIGYNFLVDRFGTVYEGRGGGVDRNVIGAHALGFNTGSVGVSLIGNFTRATPPPVMMSALVNLLAWRLDVGHVDPLSTIVDTSAGNPWFKAGKKVTLRAISGHRDTGPTECPGSRAYALLSDVAKRVSQTGGPKLYSPLVTGTLGGSIRFQARLSSALPWTVTVKDARGTTLARARGSSLEVDWRWRSAGAGKGPLRWTIDAGPSVLPASGMLVAPEPKAKPPAASFPEPKPAARPATPAPVLGPLVVGLTASPAVVSPAADGTGGYVAVNFTLIGSAAVTVQAVAVPAAAAAPRTLLSANLPAGDNSFSWSLAPLADGRYRVVVTARPKTGPVTTQSAALAVDRSLADLVLGPALISPNGDRINDSTTFGFTLAGAYPVEIQLEYFGTVVGTIFSGQLGPGPQALPWDGTTAGVRVPDGTYDAVVRVTSPLGRVSFKTPITIDTTAPLLTLLDAATLRFQVSEAATVTVTVNGQAVVTPAAAGVFAIPWQAGPVTTITAQADDAAGNRSVVVTSP